MCRSVDQKLFSLTQPSAANGLSGTVLDIFAMSSDRSVPIGPLEHLVQDATECIPRPSPLRRFFKALEGSELAAERLKVELKRLESGDVQSVLTTEDAFEVGLNELGHKIQHINGVLACYKDVRKALCLKEMAIRDNYEDLTPGPKKTELDKILIDMAQLLADSEVHLYRILGVEDGWFSRQTYELKLWARENPKTAGGIVVGCAAFLGGVLGLLNHEGIKVFFLLHIVSAPLSLPTTIITGGVIGAGLAVLGLCSYRNWGYTSAEAEAQSHLQQVRQMVEEIQKVPNQVFLSKLSEISTQCNLALGTIPKSEDRLCNICLSEGKDVEAPVKAPHCQGNHWMCKAHWEQWMDQAGNTRCTICRV